MVTAMKLIDSDNLYNDINNYALKYMSERDTWKLSELEIMRQMLEWTLKIVSTAPTIEPEKHGHWIYDGSTSIGDYFKCSECNAHIFLDESWKVSFKHVSDRKRYCHNCGAKMGGDNNA